MKTLLHAWICLFALGFAGCFPVERVWWSPDGRVAAVLAGDKPELHLVKEGGDLGAVVAGLQLGDDFPIGASWLPDGSGFVLHHVQARATWDEARAILPPDEAREIERHAATIPHLLQAAVALGDMESGIEALFNSGPLRNREILSAAFYLAREKQKDAIDAVLLAMPKGAEIVASLEAKPFTVHEICLIKVKNDVADGEPQMIARSIHPILLPKVSPKFPAVAWWKAFNDSNDIRLQVGTLDGTAQVEIAQCASTTFDWTPNGRSVVLTVPVADQDKLLQTIRRITVLDAAGALIKENQESQDLAVAIMPAPARLCVLPDERVLFASQPVKLPALSNGLDPEPRLFVVSADAKSVEEVPTVSGDLPANLSFFVASPDGKRIAVVESDTVAVAVVELATGKTEIVSPPRAGWSCRTIPAWKSATELTFAALDATSAPKWMRWKQGEGVRSISDQWPAAATSAWLSEKKEATPAVNKTP